MPSPSSVQPSRVKPAKPPAHLRRLARRVAGLVRSELGAGVRVIWFGSWIDGLPASRSDLDFAIDSRKPVPAEHFARLQSRIEDLPTLYTIDLVDLRDVGDRFRENVRKRGIPL